MERITDSTGVNGAGPTVTCPTDSTDHFTSPAAGDQPSMA